ncbi:cupin domain-containing protein [Planctomycetota bacterium]|nr:cupin domain-containing protein [Planctomycetota bacterium]
MDDSTFPSLALHWHEADIPVDGVHSKVMNAGEQQFVFMSFDEDVEVAPHAHKAQWGVVLDGEIELTIGEETKTYRKGDTYEIRDGVVHSAKIKAGYRDLTLFDQADRYKIKIEAEK